MNNLTLQNQDLIGRALRSNDFKRLIVVGLLLFWCSCMVAVRISRTGSGYYVFLLYNLFLAGVPLLLSTILRGITWFDLPAASTWRAAITLRSAITLSVVFVWLLFLPNAPYILTDIMHLTRGSNAPLWYDLALLLSCAGTGLLLGYLSLIDVQNVVARRFTPVTGWIFAIVSLLLSGFAIYLGRFLRWNSWDVLVSPSRLFDMANLVLNPFANERLLAVTVVFGVILALGYVSLRVLLHGKEA